MELLTPVRLFYVAGMIASYFLFSVSRPLQELSGQPIFRGFRLAGLTRSRSVPRHHYGPVPERNGSLRSCSRDRPDRGGDQQEHNTMTNFPCAVRQSCFDARLKSDHVRAGVQRLPNTDLEQPPSRV
jgi:hypothetical protein